MIIGNKTVKSKEIRVKLFVDSSCSKVERLVNDWLALNEYEVISIDMVTDNNWRMVKIIYKV